MNGPYKVEPFSLALIYNQVKCNTLAYWAHLQAMKKMKYCEYGLLSHTYQTFFFVSYEWAKYIRAFFPGIKLQPNEM
jgi:hypothetical protein